MTDVFTSKERSALMARIRGKDTKPEIVVRKYLFSKGFRYRVNDSRYPGTPDIVLPKYHTMIFIHGCFWHGHTDCPAFRIPKTNTDFWKNKIFRNIERDQQKIHHLEMEGWNVIVVWECDVKKVSTRKITLERLVKAIKEQIQ